MVALKLSIQLPEPQGSWGKQERRGGIETCCFFPVHFSPPLKQERRGGIETWPADRSRMECEKKQERRGGIETGIQPRTLIRYVREAGTPWWH